MSIIIVRQWQIMAYNCMEYDISAFDSGWEAEHSDSLFGQLQGL